jgi:transposase
MPWRNVSAMEQKREFISFFLSGKHTLSELCREFNVSRATGLKYVTRFKELGDPGFNALSRTPHHISFKTDPEIEVVICEFRRSKPNYGIKKIMNKVSAIIKRKACRPCPPVL